MRCPKSSPHARRKLLRLPEQRLYDRLRKNVFTVEQLFCERIENVMAKGTPDVHTLSRGLVTWLELKAIDSIPAKNTTRILGDTGLSVDQRNWHRVYAQRGGRSLIVLGIGSFVVLAAEGKHADAVNEWNISDWIANTVCSNYKDFGYYLIGGKK
jgi:hypothetical protein